MIGGAAAALREVCRTYVTGVPTGRPSLPDAWRVVALAQRHQLTPLVWAVLGQDVPPDEALAVALKRDFYRSIVRRQQLLSMTGPLLKTLAAQRVPVIALKGLALGSRYYADPTHRPMTDVDLLVHREHVETVLHAAADLGLRRYDDRHSLAFDLRFGSAVMLTRTPSDASRPSIDLHWALFDQGQFADAAAQSTDRFWERSEGVEVAGMPLLTLSREHTLVHLAAHLAVHHAFGGLLWYCDVGLLLRHSETCFDWDEIIAVAERLRLRGVLSLVLGAVGVLFDVHPPREVQRWLRPQSPRWRIARSLVLARALRLEPMYRFEYLTPLLVMDRWRDCARNLAGRIVPGREWVTLRYGSSWPVGYTRHAANVFAVLRRNVMTPIG